MEWKSSFIIILLGILVSYSAGPYYEAQTTTAPTTTSQQTKVYQRITVSAARLLQDSVRSEVFQGIHTITCPIQANKRPWSHLVCYNEGSCQLFDLKLSSLHHDNTSDALEECYTDQGQVCVVGNQTYERGEAIMINCTLMKCDGKEMITTHVEGAKDCYELAQQGITESGVYCIYPYMCEAGAGGKGGCSNDSMSVWCDMEGEDGGWTVILSRRPLVTQVNFNRGWEDYKNGFGDPSTEHWLGNDAIHAITSQRQQVLHVDMMAWNGTQKYADYKIFEVEEEENNFKIKIEGYTGTAGDSLGYHNNMFFSTFDRDNDLAGGNCVKQYGGGFWFKSCHNTSPTGPLMKHQINSEGMTWLAFYGDFTTLKEMHFKVKPSP